MNLYAFLVLALGLYALLEFHWLPRVRLRLAVDRSLTAIRQGGFYACLGFLRRKPKQA